MAIQEKEVLQRALRYGEQAEKSKVRTALRDIDLNISWGHIARDYFQKSVSWFYQRLNEVDGHGNPCEFSPEEKEQLRGALIDLSDRIRRAADNI
ncbi:MAG: DUF5053 domain-containing protein [Prevotella sp.]|nr:DUF5053 domain-containing protein [Prevotella sp.]